MTRLDALEKEVRRIDGRMWMLLVSGFFSSVGAVGSLALLLLR